MSLILGLDTGGTFTDAAIIDKNDGRLLAKAKAPTTRQDLIIGLRQAISAVLSEIGEGHQSQIKRFCLSTTLATNAVVEGMGGSVGLVMIGFAPSSLEKNGLGEALGNDPVAFIDGGHHADAKPQAKLDIAALKRFAKQYHRRVSAIAIVSHFATRNPEHEIAARDLLHAETGLPTNCSHELSSALGGPKRGLTTLLNARLINLLDQQITATDTVLDEIGLKSELMVVKGDGSLVDKDFARLRPVETVLSGPAASISGAAHLAGCKDALISDIGGTTTDITVMVGGLPKLSSKGATIGGRTTMVEAADIRTVGLGGDSEVKLIDRGLRGGVILGPRRSVPISSLAMTNPEIHQALDYQLGNPIASASDARFVIPLFTGAPPEWLTRSEYKMAVECHDQGIAPISDLAETSLAIGAIDRLMARGLVAIASFTPTDAAHILGTFTDFDTEAALKAGTLMARQRTGSGKKQAENAEDFAGAILERLTLQSTLALTDSIFAHQGLPEAMSDRNPLLEILLRSSISEMHASRPGRDQNDNLLYLRLRTGQPLIALGAASRCYYSAIAEVLGAELIVPDNADVAGAIGAAVGNIRQRTQITITQPTSGVFRVHLNKGPVDFADLEEALAHAGEAATSEAHSRALAAGGSDQIKISTTNKVDMIEVGGGKKLFIEARVNAVAIDASF